VNKIKYYRIKNGNGFWEPNRVMKQLGFSSVACGPDGPSAHRIAEEWNMRWKAHRAKTKSESAVITNPKHGYIYYLKVGDRIKIGWSGDPFTRVARMKTALTARPSTVAVVRGTKRDEQLLHHRLRAYQTSGEWFVASPAVVRNMLRSIAMGRPDHGQERDEQVSLSEQLVGTEAQSCP
jgi:hypothetical protein